jgi:glycosyltransferase involved in cell wall biosynthesis
LRFWLLTVGEPLPIVDGGNPRLLRTGVLARHLARRGHEVTWWTSTFDHYGKKQRAAADTAYDWEGVTVRMIRSVGYRRNVSLRRFIEHSQVARKFSRQTTNLPRPDAILASLPTIELAAAAAEFASKAGIPVAVDIRDLWPDAILDLVPSPARWLARLALMPMSASGRRVLRECRGIVGISQQYLDWGLKLAGRARGIDDRIFPLGYQPPASRPQAASAAESSLRAMGVDPAKTICWYVGSFGRQYDLAPVIEAARQAAADERNDVQFVISGDGEYGGKWRQMSADLSNIVFTEWIDGDQIGWLRENAAVGLQPYVRGAPQGLANKLFEYISAGIPVVSSLRGENAALIAQFDCGLTYEAGDGCDCYRQLCALLDDPGHRRRMGRNGKELFMNQFESTAVFNGLAEYLERLAAPR